jgi:putative phage-type endonuclease
VARTKTGYSTSRANYMAQLIAERLTGVPQESYTNAAMQWGIDTEAEARIAYEFYAGATVEDAGYIEHPAIPHAGASPDGLVGADGLVEIKCPQTATHIDTLLGAPIPDRYVVQMQFQMACTGRAWCDWVSYDPRMPEAMRLHIKRVHRDNARIAELESAVREFLADLDTRLAALNARYGDGPSPLRRQLVESLNLLAAG